MTSHDWFVEQRTAFVVRSLEPDEERSFREHLAGCEECRLAVEKMEGELAWLPMGVTPVAPRPGLSRVLVEGALGRRVSGASWWLVSMSLAASLLIAVGAWVWAARVVRGWQYEVLSSQRRLVHELAMVRDTLEIIRTADKVRHASISMAGREGGLVIFADDRTHRWNVVVYGLPQLRPGQMCQFWFITDSGMVRGVEVKSDGRTPAFLTLPMPPAGGTVMGAALTLEPVGSSGTTPKGQELAHLMM